MTNRWCTTLRPYYVDLKILKCPVDSGAKGSTNVPGAGDRVAEVAPRTYLINGWNDLYKLRLGKEEWAFFRILGAGDKTVRENDVREPSETVLLGEKDQDSGHFHMDFDQFDDLLQLNQNRHANSAKSGRGGGSDYTMADGSVRFMRFGRSLAPLNLWAVTDEARRLGLESP